MKTAAEYAAEVDQLLSEAMQPGCPESNWLTQMAQVRATQQGAAATLEASAASRVAAEMARLDAATRCTAETGQDMDRHEDSEAGDVHECSLPMRHDGPHYCPVCALRWPDEEDQYAPFYCSLEWVDEEAVIQTGKHNGKPHRCAYPVGHEEDDPHCCHCGSEL